MSDTGLAYLLVGAAIVFVLGLVFALSTRDARAARRAAHPPAGVHLPPPSWLPVLLALGGGIIGAGLAFTPWLLLPGSLVFMAGAYGWFRAAGQEWHQLSETDSHDETGGHAAGHQ